MQQELTNQRKVTLIQKLKSLYLKIRFKNKITISGDLRILGKMPIFKLPGNGRILLGDKVVLNSDFKNSNTALTSNCTLVCGLNGNIKIGSNTMLNGVSITSYDEIMIGENCQIASSTLISDTDFHPIDPAIRLKESMGYKFDFSLVNKKKIFIGNNVWVGWGCVILKGVTIGDNSIIAAGSVVIDDIPANVIAAGNPARVKKNI